MSTKTSKINSSEITFTQTLTEKMNALDIYSADKLAIHLVAAKRKPSTLLLLKRTTHAYEINQGLIDVGLHTTFLDRKNCKFYELILSTDKSICDTLESNLCSDNGYNMGITLGYPENAVYSFINKASGCIHSYQQALTQYTVGLDTGFLIPAFFAYSLHVPETITFKNGVMQLDLPSEELAKQYSEYIRSTDKTLSCTIEDAFKEELSNHGRIRKVQFDTVYYSTTTNY